MKDTSSSSNRISDAIIRSSLRQTEEIIVAAKLVVTQIVDDLSGRQKQLVAGETKQSSPGLRRRSSNLATALTKNLRIQIQLHKYKYKYKYTNTNTNTQIQLHKFKTTSSSDLITVKPSILLRPQNTFRRMDRVS